MKYLATAVLTGNVQPKGTAFSPVVSQLRQEYVLLSRIFLGAKDYSTFLNTAAWARVHLNEGQFVKVHSICTLRNIYYLNSVRIYMKVNSCNFPNRLSSSQFFSVPTSRVLSSHQPTKSFPTTTSTLGSSRKSRTSSPRVSKLVLVNRSTTSQSITLPTYQVVNTKLLTSLRILVSITTTNT